MPIFNALTKGIRPYFIIILLILSYSVYPALKLQPLDRDESRFMQATTQMFESKDFVRISFQDEPRNKKPIGIHWLQAASVEAFGGPDSRDPFPFRLVSIIAAVITSLSVFAIGKTLFDRNIGFVAGVMAATELLLSTEAHIAKTDSALTAFIALAFLALAKIKFEKATFTNILLFWFTLAMAVLIKGPVPIMVIGLAMIVYSIWSKDKEWQKPVWNIWGIALFLAIILPWFILIGLKTDWQFYTDAISQDLTPKLSGKAETKSTPPGLHTLISPLLLWPSTILMGFGFWAAFKRSGDARVKFLLAWLIPAWIVFELSPAKLAHYTLPVHGALFILMAYGLFEHGFKGIPKWSGIILFLLATVILSAIPIAIIYKDQPDMMRTAILLAMIIGVGGLSVSLLLCINSKYSSVMAIFTALIFSIILKGQFLPNIDALDVSRRVSNKLVELGLHPRLSNNGKGAALVGYGYQEPSLIFLTRTDSRLDTIDNAVNTASANIAANKPNTPAIIEDRAIKEFETALSQKGLKFKEIAAPIGGLNYSKGKKVLIHIGVVERR